MFRLILIFLFIVLALFFSQKGISSYEVRRKKYIILVTFLLFLQSGLRNVAVGSDTYQYYIIFENVKFQNWNDLLSAFLDNTGKDPFYSVFLKTFQVFSENYQLYLIFVAAIFMPALGHFIYKNTTRINHALLAFIIYMGNFYGFFSITGIRQTIATALLLYSYEFIKKRRLIPFLILVISASLFHISALIFLPLYFLSEFKKPKMLFKLAVFGFPLFLLFKNQIAVFFVNFIEAEDRFGVYTEQYELGGSVVLTLLHIVLAILGLRIYSNMVKMAPRTFRMYNMFAIALFLFPLQWVNPSAGRVAQYFTIIIMVWVPYIIDAYSINKPKLREFLYVFVILLLVVVTMFAITIGEYKFFWQEMALPQGY